MGIYSDWIERNHEANDKQVVNIEFVLKMLDRVACPFPVGAQYIQYPSTANNNIDLAFPIQKRPGSLWPGTTWIKLWATEGSFFRTEGGASSDQCANGIQADRIRNITGNFNVYTYITGQPTGVFTSTIYNTEVLPEGYYDNRHFVNINFNAARSVLTGTDNAPRNRVFIIWERTS